HCPNDLSATMEGDPHTSSRECRCLSCQRLGRSGRLGLSRCAKLPLGVHLSSCKRRGRRAFTTLAHEATREVVVLTSPPWCRRTRGPDRGSEASLLGEFWRQRRGHRESGRATHS